jgi:hypothetical protein
VRLLPFPYNHPVRAAEAAAVLDLSNGRSSRHGRSITEQELGSFMIDPASRSSSGRNRPRDPADG